MKTRLTLSIAIGSLVLTFGCSKQEEGSTQPSGTAATGLVEKVTTTAKEQTEAAKETVQTAATNVQAQAAAATSAATGKVQGIIDQAKKLVSENKLSEAMTSLKGLEGLQLTPEQQTMVQNLKDQIQKALDAAKSAGAGLLPANK